MKSDHGGPTLTLQQHLSASTAERTAARQGVSLVLGELTEALSGVDPEEIVQAANAVAGAPRVFALGQGRSGIALRALAMRLMHLGLDSHLVGEATAPAIRSGDVLIVASGSGTTESVVRSAAKAAALGAVIVAVTSVPDSPLGRLAAVTVRVHAAVKTDHGSTASQQYAGSLFEQSVWLLSDVLFHLLWQRSGATAEELWVRHANLE